jgi:DNA-binding transcriptional regulator LsrR (DeoR family)
MGGTVAGLPADRPSEVVLAARVGRLLDAARGAGMVRIEIGLPAGILDVALSAELCAAFGLRYAFAVDFPDQDEPALRSRLGEAAGQALMDLITPADVLGLSWARSLSGLAAALTRMPPCPIVQLTGAVPPPDGRDLLDLVRSVARVGGGPAHVLGVFIGEGGRPLPTPLDSRVIVTPGPALQRIPFVLCVAYGVAKSPAVFVAIRGGLVHGLVIHPSLARARLSLASQRVGGP